MEYIAVSRTGNPFQIEHVLLLLDVRSKPLHTVRDFNGDRVRLDAADLLEIRKLRNLHSVKPYLPAESPSAKPRMLPVILNKTDVMLKRVNAKPLQALQINLLNVVGEGFMMT